jgi:hypothetical protein
LTSRGSKAITFRTFEQQVIQLSSEYGVKVQ